jgi:hypothetical protein
MSWTFGGTPETWGIIAVPLKPSSGGSGDVTPPTDPSGLIATAIATDAISLSVTGSTDDVAVTQYLWERCAGAACVNFAQFTTTNEPTVTLTDTGLTPATLYRYRVRARDAAGNFSGYAAIAQATTFSSTTRTLTWTAQAPFTQDGFNIYRCVTTSGTCTPGATVFATALPSATTYVDSVAGVPISCYQVQATSSAAGNGTRSNIACGQTITTFLLTITLAGTGTGTTSPISSAQTAGSVVPLTATAGVLSDFAGWSGDADCSDGSVTMSAARNCTATFNLQQGTFAYLGNRGTATSKSAGTTVSVTPTATASQTNLLIVRAASDNATATSGNTSTHTSVTDTLGNQYVKLGEHTRSGGAVGSGVTTSLWASRPFASVTTNNSVTLTLGTSSVAKAISLEEYMLAANTTFSSTTSANTATNGNSTTPSATLAGLSSVLRLFLGLVGVEGPSTETYTQAANYASGTTSNGTTGGATTTNITGRFGFRRQTATGDTFSPTLGTAENWSLVYAALATATAQNASSVTLTNSGTGTGTLLGAGTFYNGTNVRIEAVPAAGSQFTGWTTTAGDSCVSPSNTVFVIQLTQNTTCNAGFSTGTQTVTNYTLTQATTGTGGGTVTGAGVYASGTTVNMTASPNSYSSFDGWSPSVCASGSITMSGNQTCTATFTLLPSVVLTITSAGTGLGTTTGAGSYIQGSTATLTATPLQGSIFTGWSGSPGCTGTTSPLTLLMDTAKTCIATYDVTSSSAPGGVITAFVVKRCSVSYILTQTSGGTIATVDWYLNSVRTMSSNPGNVFTQTIAPFIFSKSLVRDGSALSAVATDAAGQSTIFGPVPVTCP